MHFKLYICEEAMENVNFILFLVITHQNTKEG